MLPHSRSTARRPGYRAGADTLSVLDGGLCLRFNTMTMIQAHAPLAVAGVSLASNDIGMPWWATIGMQLVALVIAYWNGRSSKPATPPVPSADSLDAPPSYQNPGDGILDRSVQAAGGATRAELNAIDDDADQT